MKIDTVKYISELLYRHDCVIIPGFGGFIGNYSPATINPLYHTFFPPFKSLLFNVHLKQNDGLLASFISQTEQIPYEHAMELIREMLEEWNRELENGKELVIEKVGKLVKETDTILQFEQDLSVNYLPDAFGLTTLVSPAIRRPGIQDKLEKKLDRYIQTPAGKFTRTLKWAAVLALPVGLAVYLSLANIDQFRSFREAYSGFLFSNSSQVSRKTVESQKALLPSEKTRNSLRKISSPVLPSAVSQGGRLENTDTRVIPDPPAKKHYAIIVGAFRFRENADNLVAKLKMEGYDAGIFDTTISGLFRVSIGTFTSRDEAIGQLATVRTSSYSSAWLLSK